MDLIQKAKALCLSACLEAVIAIICICAYAIAVDVLQISQYSTLTRICCIIGMASVMGAGWDSGVLVNRVIFVIYSNVL